jgi:hypothetical protein
MDAPPISSGFNAPPGAHVLLMDFHKMPDRKQQLHG